jgi:hypothetical protein
MTPEPASARRFRALGLAAILAIAGLLRFTALDFGAGVPAARPDENIAVGVLALMPTAALPPTSFLYGGGYFYPLYAFVRLWACLAWPGSIAMQIARDPFAVQLAARAWSAVLSVATVALVYLAGRALVDGRVGLVAAALLASGTLAIREGHFAKPDTAAAFAAALLLYAIARPWASRRSRALGIGAAAGLVVSVKACVGFLPAALVALAIAPPVVPPGGSRMRPGLTSLLVGMAALAAVVLPLAIFCVLQPEKLWTIVQALREQVRAAHWTGAETLPSPLRYHLGVSLRHGCGMGFALLVPFAIARALWRGGTPGIVAIAVLGYAATVLAGEIALARYLLPIVPGLAVLVAALVVDLAERVAARTGRPALVTLALTLLLVAGPLWSSATLVRLLGRADTRALAAEWIASHVPEDAALASFGAPSIWTDYGAPSAGARRVFPRLPAAQWRARDVRYVISYSYPMPYANQPLAPGTPGLERVALFDPFDGPLDDPILEPMDAFFLPLAHFAGITRPGPRIEIYEVRP